MPFFTTGVNNLMPRRVFNLEYDVRSSPDITSKICELDNYAQNLYAALCNNEFAPKDTWALLANVKWQCSWQYASELVASIRRDPRNIWYCSGISHQLPEFSGYVQESYITPQVREDLDRLGWIVLTTRFFD